MDSYSTWARYYDAIYAASGKDYKTEAESLDALIKAYKTTGSNNLLDVACGTGLHMMFLKGLGDYQIEGLDIDEEMLAIAKARNPDILFHLGDMVRFSLDKKFAAITCLFSAIGHMKTVERLDEAIANMSRHLLEGGVLFLEPWLRSEDYKAGGVHAVFVDKSDLKIARVNVSQRRGDLSILEFYFLVGTPAGVESYTEKFEMGLFTHEQYLGAFRNAGLVTVYLSEGLGKRGLYIGKK